MDSSKKLQGAEGFGDRLTHRIEWLTWPPALNLTALNRLSMVGVSAAVKLTVKLNIEFLFFNFSVLYSGKILIFGAITLKPINNK